MGVISGGNMLDAPGGVLMTDSSAASTATSSSAASRSSTARPGRDPRDEPPPPILRSDVLKMEDLREGMALQGTVRNVVDFGAFVDIGVKQDGLVHISQMADRYVKNPFEVVSVGDVVTVRVINVDLDRGRIGLSMKDLR